MTLLLSLFACNDGGLTKHNSPPEAVIVSHSDGDSELEDQSFQLLGRISDLDHSADALTASWLVDGEPVCGPEAPDDAGNTTCDLTLAAGSYTLTLLGEDSTGAEGSANVTLTVSATGAPEVDILSPSAGATFYADELVWLEAQVSDAEDATDALTLSWSSSVGGELDLALAVDGDTVSGESTLAEGAQTLTLTAIDSSGKIGSASVDVEVTSANSAPSCEVTAPADGTSGNEGESVTFEGVVADVDQPADTLTVSWESDLYGPLSTGAPAGDGATRVTTTDLPTGTHIVTLSAADERGAVCEATVLYTVGTPPSITVTSPIDGARYQEGERITFTASVSDGEDAPQDLLLSWESDVDGEFSTQSADASGAASFTDDARSGGLHTLTVTVSDSDGFYARSVTAFTVNRPPGAPGVSITPSSPATDDDLAVVIDTPSSDADGDSLSYTYLWLRDGVATGYTDATLPASATAKNQTWTVEVTPYDSDGAGGVGDASVDVVNTAPSAPSVSITPGAPEPGEALSCVIAAATDIDGDAIEYDIRWTRDGATYGGADTDVFAGDTVPADVTEAEETWACAVTAVDDEARGGEDDAEVTVSCEYQTWYLDDDGDGYGDDATAAEACERPSADHVTEGGDCDDTDPDINYDATEWCDDVDNDCDGTTDEPNAADAEPWYRDADEDGYGDALDSQPGCTQPSGYVADDTDCDDTDGDVYPWAGDVYDDGVDQDCDGLDCEADWDSGVYFSVCVGAVGWHDGRAECQDAGYDDLASIRSLAEQNTLEDLLTDAGGWSSVAPWIGYADEVVESYWGWSDGSTATYTNWAASEPSNSDGGEDCAQMNWPLGTGEWNDADCYATESWQGYVCEIR